MLKNKQLVKIDTCLKDYVDENNTRFKRNITSILMNRQQLKHFYYDMQQQKKQKLLNSISKISKNKSMGYLDNEKKVTHWRNAENIKINKNPLISTYNDPNEKQKGGVERKKLTWDRNLQSKEGRKLKIGRKQSSILQKNEFIQLSGQYELFTKQLFLQFYESTAQHHKNMVFSPNKQYSKHQIEKIKKMQEQKYIGKYKFKMGKKQTNKLHNTLLGSPEDRQIEQNKLGKINGCLRKMIQNYSPLNNQYRIKQIQALRDDRNKKQAISKAITDYFVRKNRYYPSF